MNIIPYPSQLTKKEGVGRLFPRTQTIDSALPEEGYRMEVKEEGTEVFASSAAGFYYAEMTVKQLEREKHLPCLCINDAPKYNHRGFMIDCSRHFFTVEEIKQKITELSELKMNVFHWHLTDDQGWRIQIDAYPLLTEIGSVRASTRLDGKEVKGFYTKKDIKEVIAFAAKKHVTVIPEIDMPGHFTAAIAAYPHLSCSDKKMKVSESFGIHPEILCGGKEESYLFCKNVLKEVCELFPAPFLHLGGDEALKLRWIECPHCQKKMAESGLKNEEQLQGSFLTEMAAYVAGFGKTAIFWNDGLYGGNVQGEFAVQYWKESKQAKAAVAAEKREGRAIIASPFFSLYLDYPHGMTSLKKTYTCAFPKVTGESVLGLEAPIWAEYIEDIDKMEKMIYPRLIAVAERSWSQKNDYSDFLSRLKIFLSFWAAEGRSYERRYNPSFIQGKWEMIKFFRHALDKTMRENLIYLKQSRRAWNKKYGKGTK